MESQELLPISIIKGLYEKLTYTLQHDGGQFKKEENRVKGIDFNTAPLEQVALVMNQWIDNTQYRIGKSFTERDSVLAILD